MAKILVWLGRYAKPDIRVTYHITTHFLIVISTCYVKMHFFIENIYIPCNDAPSL